jgi:hypothetical protein
MRNVEDVDRWLRRAEHDALTKDEEDAWLAAQRALCEPLDPPLPCPPVVAHRLWDREAAAMFEIIWTRIWTRGLTRFGAAWWRWTGTLVGAAARQPILVLIAVALWLFVVGFLAGARQ